MMRKDGESKEKKEKKKQKPINIELDGIQERVVAFPYSHGRYGQIAGVEGKAIFTTYPAQHATNTPGEDDASAKGKLHAYDFKEQKKEVLVSDTITFSLSGDYKSLLYRTGGNRIRVIKAGKKADDGQKGDNKGGSNRHTGWIDLNRLRPSVIPTAEWKQMYREAWRLQRDYFWTEDMSGVDWETVYLRYLPLLERIATRAEFSDLMWEMQGELGTSHAYESGGDYRSSPNYGQGFLGADFVYDPENNGYRITHIVRGDTWNERRDSPLNAPGINVQEGDILLSIGGQQLSQNVSPGELLVNLGEDRRYKPHSRMSVMERNGL